VLLKEAKQEGVGSYEENESYDLVYGTFWLFFQEGIVVALAYRRDNVAPCNCIRIICGGGYC
jgi:hypothetical protein